jgi:hypothetical protein
MMQQDFKRHGIYSVIVLQYSVIESPAYSTSRLGQSV